jgi:ABC-type Fe3+/spermidine/putrescine transport system ATPase subunit
MQVGTPSEVYSRPANTHVATFLGTTNLLTATVTAIAPDGLTCRAGSTLLAVAKSEHDPAVGQQVSLVVRPERVEVIPASELSVPESVARVGGATNLLPARVATITFRGAHTAVLLDCGGLRVEAEVANIRGEPPLWLTPGAGVVARVSAAALRVLVS